MKAAYASIALSLAMVGSGLAADLPSRRIAPVYAPAVPVFTWTGFYVGAQIGYLFGSTTDTLAPPSGVGGIGPYKVGNTSAVTGGGHLGYLYQLGDTGFGSTLGGSHIVVGVEGDIDDSFNTSTTSPLAGLIDQHRSQVEGSVRGRLGVAFDRALIYATGGVAFAQFQDQINIGGVVSGAASTDRVGYTVGGGVEYAFIPNWSLRAEYRNSSFQGYAITRSGAFPVGGTATHSVTEQRVQVGLSYRFYSDTPTPLVARY